MSNTAWFALGAAIAWLIATDDLPVISSVGFMAGRDQMPVNNTPARMFNDADVRFQAPGPDTLASPQTVYGKGYGNQIGGNPYAPQNTSSDPATMGLAGSIFQGGATIGRGW